MSSEYREFATLSGPQDGLLSLSFSPNGKFIVATGYGGVCIWDVGLQQRVSIPAPPSVLTVKHVYTRSAWLFYEATGLYVLVLGSQRGDIVLWQWNASDGAFKQSAFVRLSEEEAEVLSLDVRRRTVPLDERGCLVVATNNNWIYMYTVSSTTNKLHYKWSTHLLPTARPRTIMFDASSRVVLAFAEVGGNLVRLNSEGGTVIGSRHDGPQTMLSVTVDHAKTVFAAYTGSAFEILALTKQKRIKTIASDTPYVYYPMYTSFGESDTVLLAGTDKGRAVLYDVEDGSVRQTFPYPKGGLVQQVATCTTHDAHYVAFAGSSMDRPADVILYQKKCGDDPETEQTPPPGPSEATLWTRMTDRLRDVAYWGLMFGVLAFCFHNNTLVCAIVLVSP
ncbi:WD40-repeat-containing domain protein [Schizophyllum commune]